MAEAFANNAASTLSGAIDATTGNKTVASTSSFPPSGSFRVKIDSEYCIATVVDGTTLNLTTRGAEGSAAASHLSGAAVTHVLTAGGLVQYQAEHADMLKADNLSGLANTATARTNLGLGTAATAAATDFVAAGAADMLKADNLSGLANTATARTNLGLGSAATQASTAFAAAAAAVPNGGTTGQVLTKHSNTDLDLEWSTPAGGGDMLKSTYDSNNDGKIDSGAMAVMTAASGGSGGAAGAVPASSAGDQTKFLRADATWQTVTGGGVTPVMLCNGRCTPSTGVPVLTADVTGAGTLYWTPHHGNQVALYNGSSWDVLTFAETSISLGTLAEGMYDLFGYSNSGTFALELVAWTNATTRATALALQDGVHCKTGTLGKRYLASVYLTGTGSLEESYKYQSIWHANPANRVLRTLFARETASSWSDTTTSWRAKNGGTTYGLHRVGVTIGLAWGKVTARSWVSMTQTSGVTAVLGVGVDSTTVNSAQIGQPGVAATGLIAPQAAEYDGYPGIGYHYLSALEYVSSATGVTFYGAVANSQEGMKVEVWA